MTPREYMNRANILLRRIKRKRREAEEIRIAEASPSSPVLSDMPKTASHDKDGMSRRICRAIDLDHEADLAFDAERIKMTNERLQQIATYKIAIILMKKMLTNGLITNAEFRSLETNIAEKCNLSLCSIYRINA